VLEITAGPHRGQRLQFDSHQTCVVGRAATVNWQLLDDPWLSRHHFVLEFNPPRCYLRDLGSSSGTQVNGRQVAEAHLQDGDVITGGQTQIRVGIAGPPSPHTVSYRPGASAASANEPGEPARLAMPAGYEVIRQLGQGGMGVVYLARRPPSPEPVALKLILPESAVSERALSLFLREISVLCRLTHPRIVRFLEMGTMQGQFFFAMEYVETVDLHEALAHLPERRRIQPLCRLACQVLDGLGYAHAAGFVHRDLKPSNLLIQRQGDALAAKISDFGLAKDFQNAGFSGMTCAGQALGTVAYMAPEQVLDARSARPPADIYSLGATLYSWLTRRPAFDFGGRKDKLAVILEDEPVPLTQVCPWVPAGLAAVVHRALRREPEQRFPDAEAMRQALQPFVEEVVP
jgi:serine/threonine-protein kinase